MKLFEIPDIRLFWSKDERFLSQYRIDQNTIFKPFSKYPPSYKDISFWVEQQEFSANDLFEIVRTVAGDVIEEVISWFIDTAKERNQKENVSLISDVHLCPFLTILVFVYYVK